MQDDFFGSAVDAVPPAHPLHLISGFQCFGHAFLAHQGSLDDFQPVFAGSVDLRQMGKELFREQQGTVNGWTMLLQIQKQPSSSGQHEEFPECPHRRS